MADDLQEQIDGLALRLKVLENDKTQLMIACAYLYMWCNNFVVISDANKELLGDYRSKASDAIDKLLEPATGEKP